ncbi:MAG: response regulator [Spirochaetota bacterium]|nr:response regulator [Spirochaetota bacterium]
MPEKPKILVAEDELSVRELLSDLLIREYSVTEASDGEEVIEAIKHQTFDLLLLDIMMPKKNGFQVAREIKSLDINLPFIFLSAKSENNDRVMGMELGADDYIIKPFTNKELQLRVKNKLSLRNKIGLRDKQLDLVHHNIMTPTGAIHGALQFQTAILEEMDILIRTGKEKNPQRPISAEDISRLREQLTESTGWMNQASEQLIKMCHNSQLTKEIVNLHMHKTNYSLNSLIQKAIRILKPPSLLFELKNPIPDIRVHMDFEKTKSVIYELMDNAMLHNDSREPKIEADFHINNNQVIITFTDNGRGLHVGDHTNIFEEYWIGHKNINHTRGQGMGLWICKKYLNAQDGDIWVRDSRVGEFTSVSFSLPISEEKT